MTHHSHTYSHARYAVGGRHSQYDQLSLVFRNGVRHRFAVPKQGEPTQRDPQPQLARVIGRRRVLVTSLRLTLDCPPLDVASLGRPLGDTPVRSVTAQWEEPS